MKNEQNNSFERLADAELDVMRVLWQSSVPLRASEIVKQLDASRSWKTQTAHVILNRLEAKGFVIKNKGE